MKKTLFHSISIIHLQWLFPINNWEFNRKSASSFVHLTIKEQAPEDFRKKITTTSSVAVCYSTNWTQTCWTNVCMWTFSLQMEPPANWLTNQHNFFLVEKKVNFVGISWILFAYVCFIMTRCSTRKCSFLRLYTAVLNCGEIAIELLTITL